MSKFAVTIGSDNVVFIDKNDKADTVVLTEKMESLEAVRAIDKENQARVNASAGAISLLNEMLKDPRFDGYKGTCEANGHVSSELKKALLEKEAEFIKPIFCAPLIAKGGKVSTIDNQWIKYAAEMRAGSYAQAKSVVTKFFNVCGQLPETSGGKLLPVRAMMKMIENIEKPKTESEGIAGKLVKLSLETVSADAGKLGDFSTAIAALKSMLTTYEGLYRESLEKLTETIGNTDLSAVSDAAIQSANLSAREAFLDAEFAAGHMDATTYATEMADIGIDVELTESV